jgi:hypothetical protein
MEAMTARSLDGTVELDYRPQAELAPELHSSEPAC